MSVLEATVPVVDGSTVKLNNWSGSSGSMTLISVYELELLNSALIVNWCDESDIDGYSGAG